MPQGIVSLSASTDLGVLMSNVVSIKSNIEKLNAGHILAAGNPVDEGAQACTVPIIVKWTDGEEANAYLKSFPKGYPASLVNEVTGFIVGRGCGLPLPRRMGFLELPEEFYLSNGFFAEVCLERNGRLSRLCD